MMHVLANMIKKELKDASRDKRSVMAGLYYALGTPIVMCLLFMVLIKQLSSPDQLLISIENSQAAPDLVRYLSTAEINHADNDNNELKKITIIIDKDYNSHISQGMPATITLIADNSNDKLQSSIRRIERALQAYSSDIASLRLIARGIDPRVVSPIQVQVQDQATVDSKGGMIIGLAIFTMIYSVFISGMNLAIDTSAGERERNSLTLLLSHPISTWQIVLSKVITVTLFAMAGLLLILLVSKFAYALVPWQELGFSVNISLPFMLLMLVIGFPVALLASSLQLFVSFLAKSFKEAQSYLTMVLIVPMAISMMSSYNIAPKVLEWVPVSGQQQALMAFVKGHDIGFTQLALSSSLTLIIAIVLIYGMQKMLKSEKVIFGL